MRYMSGIITNVLQNFESLNKANMNIIIALYMLSNSKIVKKLWSLLLIALFKKKQEFEIV